MQIHIINFVILAVVVLAAAAGVIWLQIFLSRQPGKWPGLILPALAFVLSWFPVFNIMDTGHPWQNVWLITSTLLLSNIPTIVLAIIYAALRKKYKRKAQLEKMSIHDLK
jgi:ABC-type dipeptide/oligopeptide/nickel transport system permease component